ncbi:MAG TPA: PQQ-binding-like beta-propeller repeat protein, partial [Jiangellaceae bacterium]|nr:PQQ-binding-like beta-propeller repeat protein [Jiangellaceae bacterium]
MSDVSAATRFAMVTDVHANVNAPDRADLQRRVLEHIESRDPAFVLNCGDIADVGAAEEFELYRSHVPDTLWDSVRHVPGNHESQWSTDAFEAYDDYFGPTYFSFDAGDLHVVGLDVAGMRGWSRHFGQEQLQWLENDLERVGDGAPSIIFVHVPVGSDWHYAYDDEELLRVIEPYPVRAIFNGHTHSRGVTRLNGFTQVTGRGFKNGPYYYWVELLDSESGPALEVTEVEVPADGEASHELLTEIPLGEGGPGGDLGPLSTSVRVAGSDAVVRVESPAGGSTTGVMARMHPHQVEYDGSDDEWTQLTGSSRRWIGRVDIADLPPGTHKVEVRAVDDADGVYDSSAQFEVPTGDVTVAWTVPHAGSIRGALAQTGDQVVMTTTEGVVEAYLPTGSAARSQWRTEVGPVYRGSVVTPAGEHLLVPSANHQLYALDVATGAQRWSADLEAPVMSEVAFGQVDGQDRAFVAAGTRLFCLDLDGAVRWAFDLGGVFRGTAACDGERVYAGSADGRAYALDARSGSEQWSRHLTDESTPYWRHLIGPWASHVRLLPDGIVLFSTFYNVQALHGATGDLRWNS